MTGLGEAEIELRAHGSDKLSEVLAGGLLRERTPDGLNRRERWAWTSGFMTLLADPLPEPRG